MPAAMTEKERALHEMANVLSIFSACIDVLRRDLKDEDLRDIVEEMYAASSRAVVAMAQLRRI